MRCQKALKRIPLLAGEDLPPGRAARLRKHLEGCPDCRRELETVRAALEALRAAARRERIEDWPERAWRALLARITTEAPGSRRSLPGPELRRALASGAAGVMLLAAVLLLFKDRIFRPAGTASSPAPIIVEKREIPPPREIPPQPPESELGEARIREAEPRAIAAAKPEAEPAVSPDAAGQDVVSVTLVSHESGLQVVWFFDKNFEWKGDQR